MANPKIQLRHDTSTNWQTQNPVLLEGEVAIETDSNKVKIGNGTDDYNTLPYITDQTKVNLDYSNADYQPVNKAGDTMTGDLIILSDNGHFAVKSSFDSTTTTAPSEFVNLGTLAMCDTNDNYTGYFQNSIDTDNAVSTAIGARRIIGGAYKTAGLTLKVDASGYSYCTFPNTTCVDGQWVKSNQTVMSGVSLNGSTELTYTLSLPSDGHKYEVLLSGTVTTGTTAGNAALINLRTNVVDAVCMCWNTNRVANGSVRAGGSVAVPVATDHKIYVARGTDYHGTASLIMRGYRRIGTNS